MRKLGLLTAAAALAVGFGLSGLVTPVGIASAQPGKDNIFPGRWLSSTAGQVAPLLEVREGYCWAFSSAAVDLTDFDDDNDGLIDEDDFDGIDNDFDGLVDEDITGLGGRGRIYMTHGFSGGDTDDVRVYDVQNDVWLDDSGAFGQLPPAAPASGSVRSEGVGVGKGGLVYCLGGRSGGVLGLNEAYNPTTNGWTPLASLRPRAGLGAAAVGSRIYAFGGRAAPGGPCSGAPIDAPAGGLFGVAEVYDIPSDFWADITPPTVPVTDATAIAHGSLIYLIGGCTAAGTGSVTTAVQIYDRNTDMWTPGAAMPTARANLALGILGDTIYAIGGIAFGSNLNTVEAYDIDKDQWTTGIASKVTPASEIHGVSHGGKIYVPGSGSFGASSAVFEVLLKK
jgi:hypothetical protein